MDRPLRAHEVTLADGSTGLTTDGAPSDSVALALLGVVKEKIDLVVSGINPHENIGHDVTYSGTVTAAMEAVIRRLCREWLSRCMRRMISTAHWITSTAAKVGRRVAARVLAEGLPEGVC